MPPRHGQSQFISPVSGSKAACLPASSSRSPISSSPSAAAVFDEPSLDFASCSCSDAFCLANALASACFLFCATTASTVGASSSENCGGGGTVLVAARTNRGTQCQLVLLATRRIVSDKPLESSWSKGLVLYQYSAPTATPQRNAVPFHVPLGAAVEDAKRTGVGRRARGAARGNARMAGRYILAACVQIRGKLRRATYSVAAHLVTYGFNGLVIMSETFRSKFQRAATQG